MLTKEEFLLCVQEMQKIINKHDESFTKLAKEAFINGDKLTNKLATKAAQTSQATIRTVKQCQDIVRNFLEEYNAKEVLQTNNETNE